MRGCHIHHSWKENGVLFLEFHWKELIGKKRVVQWSRGSVLKILNFSREDETAAEGTVLALIGCSQALTACLLPVMWKIMGPTQAKQDEQSKGISTWDGDAGCLVPICYQLLSVVSLCLWKFEKCEEVFGFSCRYFGIWPQSCTSKGVFPHR